MMTMDDVAKRAGVSRSTVSHVLSQHHGQNVRIPEATRQRVLAVARELDYRPNALARSVSSGKSRMIGYLVNDPHYEPYWNTIVGALAEAEQRGFTLKMLSITRGTFAERIRQCIELRLGGLIVRASEDKSRLFEEAERARIPVVTVDESQPQPFGVRVTADDSVGCRAALDHLIGLGHRRIGYLSSGFSFLHQEKIHERELLFLQEMAARGVTVPEGYVTHEVMEVYGAHAKDGLDTTTVFQATEALLDHPAGRPTAIFCWRDETALIAIRACRAHGLRVPQDISVVGFSDINAAQLYDPPLTTCTSPWEEMGRMAVRQLEHLIGRKYDPSPQVVLIPTGLVIRQSSGPAPS